jgi:NRPS condensation-like uncharacterized protein
MSALIPFPRKITWLDKLFIRLSFPFFLPRVAWTIWKIKQDRNPLHDGVRNLSGNKISATSEDIMFNDVKIASKGLKVTINDMITACVASGISQYFEKKGAKDVKNINIAVPANIRFGHYPTWEKVKFENKFAPVPMTIPLSSDLKTSMSEVAKVTAKLRNQFIDVYATYAMTFYSCMFLPYYFLNWFQSKSTLPYTLAFSNTPGLVKPITFEGRKSIKM